MGDDNNWVLFLIAGGIIYYLDYKGIIHLGLSNLLGKPSSSANPVVVPSPNTPGPVTTPSPSTGTGTPTPTIPSPTPAGPVLWDSNTNGKWNNGHARSITGHQQADPDNSSLQVAAGSGRKFDMPGNGKAFLSGDQSRIYIYVNNYNAIMDVTYVPNASNENLSLRLRSRHGESGACDNRFGGYGASLHPHSNLVKIKREDCHNIHTDASPAQVTYSRKIPDGKPVNVRMIVRDEGSAVATIMQVDYDGNGQFTQIAKGLDNSPKPYMVNKTQLGQRSYAWIRTNGAGTKNVELQRVIISSA